MMEMATQARQARQARQEPDIVDDIDDDTEIDVGHEMTRDEAREFFDGQAQAWLGMSGEEFMRAWDAGEISNEPERTEVTAVALLLGFGRFGRQN